MTSNAPTMDIARESAPPNALRAGLIARLLHGTGAGAFAYGLGIVSNLLLLPLYLRFWSTAVYGEWMALYSAVLYLGNLDFGVTTAAVNAATIAYARKDWKSFKRVQGTAWAASLMIAGVGAAIVAVIAFYDFRVDQWLGLRTLSHNEARLVFCGLAISLLANIPGRQLIAVYIAMGQFAKYQWIYNAFGVFSCLAIAITLSIGGGPVMLAAVTASSTLFTVVTASWLLVWQSSWLHPRVSDSDWDTAKSLAAPTGQFGISMLATALTVQGPVVILSRALGGPAVALFTTTRTVTNIVRGTVILLRAPLRPELGAASTMPGKDALRRLFRVGVSMDTTIAFCLSTALWFAGEWVIRFWSRGRIHPDLKLLHLLLAVVIMEGFLQALASSGAATNRFKAVSLGQLATSVLALILAGLFIGRLGLSAVPIAAIIPLVVIMTPIAVKNAQKEACLTLQFVTWRLLIPFILLGAFSAWLAGLTLAPLWLWRIFSCILIAVAVAVTGTMVFLSAADRMVLRCRLAFYFSRGSGL